MARVKFYRNILDNKYEEFEIKDGTSIDSAIKKYSHDNPYAHDIVECYDSETGETFFANLSDEYDHTMVTVTVNGNIIKDDYEVKEGDVINIVFIPSSNAQTPGWVILGVLAGALATYISVASFGTLAPWAIATLTGLGGVLGGLGAGLMSEAQNDDIGKISSGQDSEKAPNIRGASNSSLVGNCYPFVIGKQHITPFVVGNPITTFEGEYGEDARIKMLLCAGYSPLKLTDFMLDDSILAYNGGTLDPAGRGTLMRGLLEYKNSSGSVTGDILDLWNDNDVKLEIIQNSSLNYDNPYRGSIYPTTKLDKVIDANCLFIADDLVADRATVVYKSKSFPKNFRTNNVYFSESCPRKLTLTLHAPSGLYRTRTKEGDPVYDTIPLWYAIQYRYYNELNNSPDSTGSDFSTTANSDYWQWHNFDCPEIAKYKSVYTQEQKDRDLSIHAGNKLSDSTKADINVSWVGKELFNFEQITGEKYNREMRLSFTQDLTSTISYCFDTLNKDDKVGRNGIKGIEVRIIRISPSYINERTGGEKTGPWSYSDSLGVHSLVTEIFDEALYKKEEHIVSSEGADVGAKKINVKRIPPLEPRAEIIIHNNAAEKYIITEHTENTITLDRPLSAGIKPLENIILKNKKIAPVYAVPNERDLNRFCYIAISVKADLNGYILNSLQKFSCTAEAFAPQWDKNTKKWLPEGVKNTILNTGYYYPDGVDPSQLYLKSYRDTIKNKRSKVSDDALVTSVTYEEITEARRDGFDWVSKRSVSNFSEIMKQKFFPTDISSKIYLSDDDKIYNGNSSASGAMLALVGLQSGLASVGYDDINLSSFGEWAEDSEHVQDGSTDDNGELVSIKMCANGYVYKGEKLETLLAKIMNTGRAFFTYDSKGKVKAIMDKPVPYPVGIISDQNCESTQNSYSYTELPAGLSISFEDENDNYETNTFFCWSDGNSYNNYHGEIIPYSIPFVTNAAQCWSLGRYYLANTLLNKSILTRKIGPEGCIYELGDVVLVQSSRLLIGDSSGRIQARLILDGVLYGFITDSVYTYNCNSKGETDMGVTILQSHLYGKNRTVSLELANKGSNIIIDGIVYKQTKGLTNVALLKEPVKLDPNNKGEKDSKVYDITTGDICLFGVFNKTTEPYRIVKIKQDSPTSFTQTLLKYNESIYNYGKKLPSFQSFKRTPNVVKDPVSLIEVPNNLVELNDENKANNEIIQQQIDRLYSNHIITLYKRTKSLITETGITSDAIYDFSTNKFAFVDISHSNGWTPDYSVVASTEGNLYSITATAFGKEAVDTITASEWSYPVLLTGRDGVDGSDGSSGLTVYIEKPAIVYKADNEGNVKEETIESKVILQRNGIKIPFFIGDINVPEGFEITTRRDTVILKTIPGKTMLPNGFIKIPINYHPIIKDLIYDNGNDQSYGNETSTKSYGYFEFSDEIEVLDVYISYAKAIAGKSINRVEEYYIVTNSGTNPPGEEENWVENKIPPYEGDKTFLWNKEITYFNNNEIASATAPSLVGNKSKDGKGIASITDYYQVTKNLIAPSNKDFTPATPGEWSSDPKQNFTDENNRYLWNFEYITYSDKTNSYTEPALIGTHGKQGITGRSVATVNNYYLKTTIASGVTHTTESDKWVLNPPQIPIPDTINKYIWGYEETLDQDKVLIKRTNPVRIVTYAEDGRGVSSIVDKYALNDDKDVPPSDFQQYEKPPVPTALQRYLWNVEEITYTKGNPLTEITKPRVIGMYGAKGEPGGQGEQGTQGAYYMGVYSENPSDTPENPLVHGCWYLSSANGNIYIYDKDKGWDILYGTYEIKDYNDHRVQACVTDMINIAKDSTSMKAKFDVITNLYVTNLVAGTVLTDVLFAKKIKIGENGAIIGGERYDENGNLASKAALYSKPGFYLGTNGVIKGNLQSDEFDNIIIGEGAVGNVKYIAPGSDYKNIAQNIVLGKDAGKSAGIFNKNVLIGDQCVMDVDICAENTFIGYNVNNIYKSINCTIIGANNSPTSYTDHNIILGYHNITTEDKTTPPGESRPPRPGDLGSRETKNNIIIGNKCQQDAGSWVENPPVNNILIGNNLGKMGYPIYDDYGNYHETYGIKSSNQILIGNMEPTSGKGWISADYINIGNHIIYRNGGVHLDGVFELDGNVLTINIY